MTCSQVALSGSSPRRTHRRAQAIGILVQVLQRGAFGADETAAEDVIVVAADAGYPIAAQRDREPAGGFAERAVAIVDASCRRPWAES